MPVPTLRRLALLAPAAVAAAVLASPRADAAEGSLPVRPGDSIRGVLQRCLDRQVAEVALLKGEVFRMTVRSAAADNESILLRVLDPDGFPVNHEAKVRLRGGTVVAGPFRVPRSGTWRFEISTLTAHGAAYDATTAVRRARAGTAVVGDRRGGAVVAAPAGATLRLRGQRLPTVSLRRPGESVAQVLAPDSPEMRALVGDGLAVARSGAYEFGVAAGRGSARITVLPPKRVAAEVVEFPTLPSDPHAVATWQGPAGWFVDPTRTAPDAQGETPPPPPPVPATSPFSGSIVEDGPAAGDAPPPTTLDDADVYAGPGSGVGFPSAGIPRLEDVVRDGRVESTGAGPSYVLTRSSSALGDVTTRVWFLVEGRPSLAPLALDGRVRMRWEDSGGSQHLSGVWQMTFDPVRGVQVLDGAEGRSPDGVRSTTSAAQGFALAGRPGSWPRGRLSLGFTDLRLGADFTRSETFDGDAAVTVDVRRGDGSLETVVHEFPER